MVCHIKGKTRMTGLEAGGAVQGKRSCFKASSGDHPKRIATLNQSVLYLVGVSVQDVFFYLDSEYLYKPVSRCECGRSPQQTNTAGPWGDNEQAIRRVWKT
jgi:hypothetical protein